MEARVRGVLEVSGGDVRVTLAAEPGTRPRLGEIRVAKRRGCAASSRSRAATSG